MKNEIYPCLWFNNNAEEAVKLYGKAFQDLKVLSSSPLVVMLEIFGRKTMLLNGGPYFEINPSISLYLTFEEEEKLNHAWDTLIEGGSVLMSLDRYDWSQKYGWIQDRFGVNWQLSLGKANESGQKIIPSLLFTGSQNGNAEKAVRFYTSLFSDSDIRGILRYGTGESDKEGNVKHAQFRLGKNEFIAMESSHFHKFSFNEGFSLVVECDDQKEIDYFWDNFTALGEESQCGWLKDEFGVSWQIIPAVLSDLMREPEKSQRVMDAFMKMKKFDIETLLKA